MDGGYRESGAEDRSILVVAFAGKVFGIAPADGSVRWEHSVAYAGAVELQIHGGRVFASTGASLHCLDYATGRLLGKVQVPDRYKGRPSMVIEGDRLYLGSQGEVTCFRLSDGAALWTQGLEGKGLGRVALGFPGNVRQADDAGTR
ncbi:MAG: PQQ-binding-like beta-propeller repeat protein [Myxococcota bacterium]|nr:PQQ-binding-like beta-propeller repeat protein [Myxococcota bacterium]